MDKQEALTMLEQHQAWAKSQSPRYAEAVEVAIEALERQVPKKPINQYFDNVKTVDYCPNCNRCIEPFVFGNAYCRYCGQALDWSEE